MWCITIGALSALDVSPALQHALQRFGADHNLSIAEVSFRQHESYFYEHPEANLCIDTSPHVIYLSPGYQKSLLALLSKNGGALEKSDKAILMHALSIILSLWHRIDPGIENSVRMFYARHGISRPFLIRDRVVYQSRADASALQELQVIFLSNTVQKRLLSARHHKKEFSPKDQQLLLHEYGHLIQDQADELLQCYSNRIPFLVDDQHACEIAADFYGFLTMKPSVLSHFVNRYGSVVGMYNKADQALKYHNSQSSSFYKPRSWHHYMLKKLIKIGITGLDKLLDKDTDGEHPSYKQYCFLIDLAHNVHGEKIYHHRLLGYTMDEIEHAWPEKPVLRRIGYRCHGGS